MKKLVYCIKCGAQNSDTANNCTNCGALLQTTYGANPQDWHYYKYHNHYHYEPSRRTSGWGLLIAGLIVVALGLTLLYGKFGLFIMYFWPIVLVILGLWLLIHGLILSQHRNR